MARSLTIDKCSQCPYCHSVDGIYRCNHPFLFGENKMITPDLLIPNWCPLPVANVITAANTCETTVKRLTEEQIYAIRMKMRNNIIDRYDYQEYWDMELLRNLIREAGLEDEKDILAAIKEIIDYFIT